MEVNDSIKEGSNVLKKIIIIMLKTGVLFIIVILLFTLQFTDETDKYEKLERRNRDEQYEDYSLITTVSYDKRLDYNRVTLKKGEETVYMNVFCGDDYIIDIYCKDDIEWCEDKVIIHLFGKDLYLYYNGESEEHITYSEDVEESVN